MTEQKPLSGLTVLIVEDDFFIADDAHDALAEAGARVIGPCSNFDSARNLISQRKPDCALLDLNLGNGPEFTGARYLVEQDVSVLLVTGYDCAVVPPDLAHLKCLNKPTTRQELVRETAKQCGR